MNFDVTSHIVWLDRSLGATKPNELGIEYNSNMSISDVEKMIKQKLGDKWRLPTDDELLKLFKYFETQEPIPYSGKYKGVTISDKHYFLLTKDPNNIYNYGPGARYYFPQILSNSGHYLNYVIFGFHRERKFLGEIKILEKKQNYTTIIPVKDVD